MKPISSSETDSYLINILNEKGYDTDKHTNHSYIQDFYEKEFSVYQNKPISLLEVGVLDGESLKLWHDYFKNQKNIVGIDIFIRTDFEKTKNNLDGFNVKIHKVDSFEGDGKDRKEFENIYSGGFDIIIDDGLHKDYAQIKTFNNFSTMINPGGIYIIEDLEPHNIENIKESIKDVEIYQSNSHNPREGNYKQNYGVIRF